MTQTPNGLTPDGECPFCMTKIHSDADVCPACGAFKTRKKNDRAHLMEVVSLLVWMPLLASVIGLIANAINGTWQGGALSLTGLLIFGWLSRLVRRVYVSGWVGEDIVDWKRYYR